MKEFSLTKEDMKLLQEIKNNRNENYGQNINISKLTQNIIYNIAETLELDFEEAAELLIHKGERALTVLKIKFDKQ